MSGFWRQQGALQAEGVALEALAAAEGTPLYVYSAAVLRERATKVRQAFADLPVLVCYAIKANDNLAVIRVLAEQGLGADTVSGGEVLRALAAGVPPARIVLAGLAKTEDEIRLALHHRILQLNVESLPELERIAAIAAELGTTAPVAIRVNPDVAAATHEKISTGRKGDKFGIPLEEVAGVVARARALAGIEPVGLHIHIGSQITSTAPLIAAYERIGRLYAELRAAGAPLRRLDLGGGFGVGYGEGTELDLAPLAAAARRLVERLGCELILEPGRYLVADAGVVLTRVIYVKQAGGRRLAVLDAGMHTLLRPALYGARHPIEPVKEPSSSVAPLPVDVVGPICETSDSFGRDYLLPPLGQGDLVVVQAAGAYGAVMASGYNSRPSAAEILVDGDRYAVIRPREPLEAIIARDRIPEWLNRPAGGSAEG